MKTGVLEIIIGTLLFLNSVKPIIYSKLVIGSDDEVLTPIFEKNDVEIAADSSHDPSRLSKKRTSKSSHRISRASRLFHYEHGSDSFLKTNLDPSDSQNSVNSSPHPSISKLHASASSGDVVNVPKFSLDLPSIKSNLDIRQSLIKNVPESADFNVSSILIESKDIEQMSDRKAPILNNSGKQSTLKPGTVIVSISESVQSGSINSGKLGTITTTDNNKLENSLADQSSNNASLDENKLPINSINITAPSSLNRPTPPAIKHKRVRALEEYTICSMHYDYWYNGPRIDLKTNITVEFINSTLIPYFKSGKILDRKSAYSIFFRAYQELLEEDTLQDIELGEDENIIIFGDIHGQFPDFIRVIEKEGLPSQKLKYLFNGDIVDRGAYSVECLMTLLAFKVADPKNFFISLGNHETSSVGKLQFFKETMRKYGHDEFFKLAHSLFKSFPIAYLIQKEVFITHGGITPEIKLEDIREIERLDPDLQDQELINDLIWSDPVNKEGFTESHRGLGILFGPDITKQFVISNNISVVIRSHQFKEFGFSEQHDGLCITIFSCPKYKGKMKNYGAYIKLDSHLNLTYVPFRAADPLKSDEYPIFPNDLKLSRNVLRIK